jgi:hypothetical protein
MRHIFSGKNTDKNKTREEIEEEAFTQMRKAKASIDPGVLAKVRAAIQNSPMANKLMGNVALKETDTKPVAMPNVASAPERVEAKPPKPSMSAEQLAKKEKALLAAKQAHAGVKESEPVDQGKMLDIVAKMIELNPHKAGLKKGVKDILKGK